MFDLMKFMYCSMWILFTSTTFRSVKSVDQAVTSCLLMRELLLLRWQGQSDDADGVGRLEIDCVKEEERRIVLKAAGGEAFSITYQMDYPNSMEEYLVSLFPS